MWKPHSKKWSKRKKAGLLLLLVAAFLAILYFIRRRNLARNKAQNGAAPDTSIVDSQGNVMSSETTGGLSAEDDATVTISESGTESGYTSPVIQVNPQAIAVNPTIARRPGTDIPIGIVPNTSQRVVAVLPSASGGQPATVLNPAAAVRYKLSPGGLRPGNLPAPTLLM